MGVNVNSTGGFSAVYNSSNAGGGWLDGLSASFGTGLNFVGKVGKFVLAGQGGTAGALGGAAGAGGLGGGGGATGSDSNNLFSLLEEQNRLQLEMQTFSMISNISKTEHESRMNLVRNMRP